MDPTTPPPPPPPPPPAEDIPNYLVPAILATLCCCLPAGVVSIIFAAQVNTKKEQRDYAGARESSRKARLWMFIAVGLGVVSWILSMVFGFLGMIMSAMGA